MSEDFEAKPQRPVLRFLSKPRPKSPENSGGKGRDTVVEERLREQARKLQNDVAQLIASFGQLSQFSGRVHLVAEVFPDSIAPTHVPVDLIGDSNDANLVFPLETGYVFQASLRGLREIYRTIIQQPSYKVSSDVSRTQQIRAITPEDKYTFKNLDDLWYSASDAHQGKRFLIRPSVFRNADSRDAVVNTLSELAQRRLMQLPRSTQALIQAEALREFEAKYVEQNVGESLSPELMGSDLALAYFLKWPNPVPVPVRITSQSALGEILNSGAVSRLDPVSGFASSDPGSKPEPSRTEDVSGDPIVGVVDGGLNARSYEHTVAWRATPLIASQHAIMSHGNQVVSQLVDGDKWNDRLQLPRLPTQVGVVQCIPRDQYSGQVAEDQLVEYLSSIFDYYKNTKVWNISANIYGGRQNGISVSGDLLARLARRYNVLLTISVGNATDNDYSGVLPPADCEAALTVGGRLNNKKGLPSTKRCPVSLQGPGPQGMLKPEISWFSYLRLLGGGYISGSSFATPLVSRVAAHTFEKLSDPDADLVKALLIARCDRKSFAAGLGWGSPRVDSAAWECDENETVLLFTTYLQTRQEYYWDNIPVPSALIENGRLKGEGRLVGVFEPRISPWAGAHYFTTRFEGNLQCLFVPKSKGSLGDNEVSEPFPILGNHEENIYSEKEARDRLKKWSPIGVHAKEFDEEIPEGKEPRLRLRLRVFERDSFQFSGNVSGDEHKVSVALVLRSIARDSELYDEMVRELGNDVASGVVDEQIEISG